MMNKYAIGTIVGSALLGISRRGSKLQVKKEPYIMVIPGKWWEVVIEAVPAEVIYAPIPQDENETIYGRVVNLMKKFIVDIPENEKNYISKVDWSIDIQPEESSNPDFWSIKIYVSPHVFFQPNVFTDWKYSTATREALNYMFNPDDDLSNFFNYLYNHKTGAKLEEVIEEEFADLMGEDSTVWSDFDNELNDSDDSWRDESWENRYENWGDGAISVYNEEKFVFYNKEGEIVEPSSPLKSKLRKR